MNFNYRKLGRHEENPHERMMLDLTVEVFQKRLDLTGIETQFMTECAFGEISFDYRIVGLAKDSRRIFIHEGLNDRYLVETVVHELRHCWQRKNGRHCRDSDTRERDARIFELEANVPATGPEIRRWLWLEQSFDRDPKLRQAFAFTDKIMSRPRPTIEATRSAYYETLKHLPGHPVGLSRLVRSQPVAAAHFRFAS